MQAEPRTLRVALLDLNNGHPNQGMRCLREIVQACDMATDHVSVIWDEFDVRQRGEVPDLSYDVYLSSGGPGSPFEGEGQPWEEAYFAWFDRVWTHNAEHPERPKRVFLICHSLQMIVRRTGVARVTPRKSESFGIFPVFKTEPGEHDRALKGLSDPFFAADFRSFQIVEPDESRMADLGAELLALEKIRPHIDLERAVMAIRFSEHIVGTQFHPEADPAGMLVHFRQPERRAAVIAKHGQDKYDRIVHRMAHPDYLARTHHTILPRFLLDSLPLAVPDAWRRAA